MSDTKQHISISINGHVDSGKCFKKGTLVMMYDCSSRRVEDLKVGDQLMGDDSKPRTIKEIHTGNDQLYAIKPNVGDAYVTNGKHTLVLKADIKVRNYLSYLADSYQSLEIADSNVMISVEDYLRLPPLVKGEMRGFRRSLTFKTEKAVDLSPEVYGFYVGSSNSDYIVPQTIEIAERLERLNRCFERRDENGEIRYYFKDCVRYSDIAEKRLRPRDSIPEEFRINVHSIRFAFMRAFHSVFDQSKPFRTKELYDDTVFLARSLGYDVKTIENRGYFKTDYNVEMEHCAHKEYEIQVTPAGRGDFVGFEVDGNHRFLLHDFSVVHNSTTTGHLIFKLGGIKEREMEKLRAEAEAIGKGSFAFAFYMDMQKEERARGITIAYTTKEFFTNRYHYTIVDCPGHSDYIKNMVTGSSQVDVAVLMVPADGNFTTSIAKGNPKAAEVQGQTRQHSLLLNLLGVKQLIVCVNKMDSDTAKFSEERFREIQAEMKRMLVQTGWNKKVVEESIPIIPISGWKDHNLDTPSDKMPWWQGVDVVNPNKEKVHVHTLLDALDKFVAIPKRPVDKPFRMPISGFFSKTGSGDVATGAIVSGSIKPDDKVRFVPTDTPNLPCQGKVFTIEMHHRQQPIASTGDNVGMNIKGLPKEKRMKPRVGDVMVLASDKLQPAKRITVMAKFLAVRNELKVGYCPNGFIRTARAPFKLVEIKRIMNKETGGQWVDNPVAIKAQSNVECVFEPLKPIVAEPFVENEFLGRLALFEGHECMAIGKVTKVEF